MLVLKKYSDKANRSYEGWHVRPGADARWHAICFNMSRKEDDRGGHRPAHIDATRNYTPPPQFLTVAEMAAVSALK
jgi:hypothetical protein